MVEITTIIKKTDMRCNQTLCNGIMEPTGLSLKIKDGIEHKCSKCSAKEYYNKKYPYFEEIK